MIFKYNTSKKLYCVALYNTFKLMTKGKIGIIAPNIKC